MKVLAQPLNYQELIGAIGARVVELNVAHEPLEQAMGLTGGHLGKLLGPGQVKRLGVDKMWDVLECIGVRVVLVEHLDIAATIEEMGNAYRPRKRRGKRGNLRRKVSPAVMRVAAQHFGMMGRGIRKTFRIPRHQVRKQRKMAIKARWRAFGRN